MAVAGTNVYLANSQDGLRIYGVSDPLNPVNIGHAAITKLGSQLFAVAAAGNYAYVGNTVDGLHIYDVSDPTNPAEVGSVNVGFVRSIALLGNYVYLANDTSGLRIFRQVPQIGIKLTATNTVLLSWPATQVLFSPQQSTNLASTNWVTLTNSPTTTGATCQLTIPTPAGNTFYRLIDPSP